MPEVGEPTALGDALAALRAASLRCCWRPTRKVTGGSCGARRSHPIVLLIGPEGGLADNETAVRAGQWFHAPVGSGPRVMRTETAGLAALAALQALAGDFQ